MPQAEALDDARCERAEQPLAAVLKFAISDEMAVRRLSNRWTCPTCKRTYNMEFKRAGRTTRCATSTGAQLERRADDDELTVRRRLAVYEEQTEPLERVLRRTGACSRTIDAEAREDDVTAADARRELEGVE